MLGSVVLEKSDTAMLPSSSLKHYQLNCLSTLVYDTDNEKMVNKIIDLAKNCSSPAIVCCQENANLYSFQNVVTVASKNDLMTYSKNLFSSLRKASSFLPDMIFIEGVKKENLGIAIMDRLEGVCERTFLRS